MKKKIIIRSSIVFALLILFLYAIPKYLEHKAIITIRDCKIDFEANQPPPTKYFEAIEKLELASKFPIFGKSSRLRSFQYGGMLYSKLFNSSLSTISELNHQSYNILEKELRNEHKNELNSVANSLRESTEQRMSKEINDLYSEQSAYTYGLKLFRPYYIINKDKAYYYCKFWKSTIRFYEKDNPESEKLTKHYYTICEICEEDKE
jgi:hypothetical protein